MTMLTIAKIALVAAFVLGSGAVALADGEFDGNLSNRYPGYAGGFAGPGTFQGAPVALPRRGAPYAAPVRMQNRGYAY
jgi:hypothetical protein